MTENDLENQVFDLAYEYIIEKESNLYTADASLCLSIFGNDVDVETIWYNSKEAKIYLHCGCNEFEGDLDITSLSDKNLTRLKTFFEIHK